MIVLVCGGREYKDGDRVRDVLAAFHEARPIVRLIEGGADGADEHAKAWREKNRVAGKSYKADWNRFGRAAGPIRNEQMLDAEQPDVVIAFPGGAGTAHMVKIATDAGVEVLIVTEAE